MVMNYQFQQVSSLLIHLKLFIMRGTSNKYRHFAGSYAIQWTMINYAIDHGIDRYNFYGISGNFSEDAEDVGVIKFKKVSMQT